MIRKEITVCWGSDRITSLFLRAGAHYKVCLLIFPFYQPSDEPKQGADIEGL